MSKKRSKSHKSRAKPRSDVSAEPKPKEGKAAASEKPARGLWPSPAAWREIIENVVVAFVLAFLFRTFEAEAFVIPTGSMAPTLMGRHKDVVCPECGYAFQVSASDEVNSETGVQKDNVISATCPMCRRPIDLSPANPEGETYRSFKGDRILVEKLTYQFRDPERWDVAVFKYPGGAKTNFIKRVVGLPNETVVLSHGDVFVKPAEPQDFINFGSPPGYPSVPIEIDQFTIARKPPRKLRAMLQPVYDNDRVLPHLIEAGWPPRWSPPDNGAVAGTWTPSEDYRSFQTDGSSNGDVWIQYRHIVPSHEDWQDLLRQRKTPHQTTPNEPKEWKGQLISDFSAYNTEVLGSGIVRFAQRQTGSRSSSFGGSLGQAARPEPTPDKLGLHWVGDLAVECEMEVQSQTGDAIFELVEGGRIFQCRLDVATGRAELSIDGLPQFHPTAKTDVRGPGTYEIMFSNIDDQLLLWVNQSVVRFDTETTYGPLGNTRPQDEDLRPVRIGSRGAALRVSHLKIHRDIYYIAERLAPGVGGGRPITDIVSSAYRPRTRQERASILSKPKTWDYFAGTRQVAFPLGQDRFLMLGDNSAESKDSRLWESEHFKYYVSRELLIGKALFIYWPHSLDQFPGTDIPCHIPIPFTNFYIGFPNFWRMHFVR